MAAILVEMKDGSATTIHVDNLPSPQEDAKRCAEMILEAVVRAGLYESSTSASYVADDQKEENE